MSALAHYLINIINQSDLQAQQEYEHSSPQEQKLVDESAEELGALIDEDTELHFI